LTTAAPVIPPAPATDELLARVIRPDVLAMHAYAVAPSEGLIKLDAMENPFSLPDALARGLGEHLASVALNRYPPGNLDAFRQRLGDAFGLPPGQALTLGNGSDELIHLLIQACAKPGATVMAAWPSFTMYRISAQLNGCRFVGVDLDKHFQLDVPRMLDAITHHQPALIFLSYPNNPTGNLFDRSAIERVLAAAPGLVVLDEAYLPFAQTTWIGELPHRGNLLVLRTLSKLGLAGLRLGYLCGSAAAIRQIDKVRPPYNVNVLTLAAVEFLLDHQAEFDHQAALLRATRSALEADLRAMPGLTVFASAANFLLFRVAPPYAAPAVFATLRERGVLIKDVSGMHPLLGGCLRVTVGTPDECRSFADALRDGLRGAPAGLPLTAQGQT
jgi:histidinol-phosphate aminotransferase